MRRLLMPTITTTSFFTPEQDIQFGSEITIGNGRLSYQQHNLHVAIQKLEEALEDAQGKIVILEKAGPNIPEDKRQRYDDTLKAFKENEKRYIRKITELSARLADLNQSPPQAVTI